MAPNADVMAVVPFVPRERLQLGSMAPFSEFLEPMVELLKLVVRPEPELGALMASILWKRLPHLLLEEIMKIAGIQLADISEACAFQDIKAMGRSATGAIHSNLTLSLVDHLPRQVREVALRDDTSTHALVREFLTRYADARNRKLETLAAFEAVAQGSENSSRQPWIRDAA